MTLKATSPAAPDYTIEGEVVDWRGDAIKLRVGSGAERSYPGDRVLAVQTSWPSEHQQAEAAFARGGWEPAAEGFATALRAERRGWARRRIAIRRLECLLAANKWAAAGDLLISIDTSDPTTRAWRLAPLPWFASDAVSPRTAERWLKQDQPAARLLGAAWLLMTPQSRDAIDELRLLARSRHASIATLAETQLWRRDLVSAGRSTTDRWARRLEPIPDYLAPGPQHLLAQAYRRQKRYDDAALAALQAPLTGAAPYHLKSRGIELAARVLREAGHADEADRLRGGRDW